MRKRFPRVEPSVPAERRYKWEKCRLTKISTSLAQTAADFELTVQDQKSNKRLRQIVRPRQIACDLVKQFARHSLLKIGHCVCGRDETAIRHSVNRVETHG
jgi:chromosomal replication initiator protein